MTPSDFKAWLDRMGMNPNQAAEFLGVDRKTVERYLSGDLPIPRRTELALASLDGLRVYKLTPIDITHNDWRASAYKGEVIVRAQSESLARWHAATQYHRFARRRDATEDTPLNPWPNPERVTSTLLPDGHDGIEYAGQPGIVKGRNRVEMNLHEDSA